MESLKSSKYLSLLARETKNAQAKGKEKGKDKRNTEFYPKDELVPSDGSLGSKKDKKKRFENTKCCYCKKENHSEKGYMKKTIDQMFRLLEKHHIVILEGTRKINPERKTIGRRF